MWSLGNWKQQKGMLVVLNKKIYQLATSVTLPCLVQRGLLLASQEAISNIPNCFKIKN